MDWSADGLRETPFDQARQKYSNGGKDKRTGNERMYYTKCQGLKSITMQAFPTNHRLSTTGMPKPLTNHFNISAQNGTSNHSNNIAYNPAFDSTV